MKTSSWIATLHVLIGPPLGGLACFIVVYFQDRLFPAIPDFREPILSLGGFIVTLLASYPVGFVPALITGLWLGRKVARSGTYSTWEAVRAGAISACAVVLMIAKPEVSGRPIYFGIIAVSVVLVLTSVFAAIAVRKFLVWSDFLPAE